MAIIIYDHSCSTAKYSFPEITCKRQNTIIYYTHTDGMEITTLPTVKHGGVYFTSFKFAQFE